MSVLEPVALPASMAIDVCQLLRHPDAVAAAAGVAAHLGIFIRGEWHLEAALIVQVHFVLFCIMNVAAGTFDLASLTTGHETSILANILVVFRIASCYTAGLLGSIAIYRLLFHPLTRAGFRGPWQLKITKLWHVYNVRNSNNHLYLDGLHKQYGDFVRTGPREVTVYDPEIFNAIDGPKAGLVKADWYDLRWPAMSLVNTRDKETHDPRRKLWKQGLGSDSIAAYVRSFVKYLDALDEIAHDDAVAGSMTNINDVMHWFGFDAMGEFMLSRNFDMLRDRKWNPLVQLFSDARTIQGPLNPAPWSFHIMRKLIPRFGSVKHWTGLGAWCNQQILECAAKPKPAQEDMNVMDHLIADAKKNGMTKEDLNWLHGDSLLAIIAGSEPIGMTLTVVMHSLAKRPDYLGLLHKDLSSLPPESLTDLRALSTLPRLQAIIHECLRLYPALLTAGNRITGPSGLVLKTASTSPSPGSEVYFPPETVIVAPRYTISRREDCFHRATEFLPERWHEKPEWVFNRSAFAPFGTGHNSCLGRQLATEVVKMVLARFAVKYTWCYGEGDDGRRMHEGIRDNFTMFLGHVNVQFSLR